MNNTTLGEVLRAYESKSRGKFHLEDLVTHIKNLSEQLAEQTLFENDTLLAAGSPQETALSLAIEAILVFEKVS